MPTNETASADAALGEKPSPERSRHMALTLTALGVVYGDIGTSPLYALRACFHGDTPVAVSSANVLGVLSLIFWALILIISLKYLLLVMRADNRGEGGILALLTLADPERARGRRRVALILIGVFGAALLYGDGMITPAISVLSAVEGLKVAEPELHPLVIPLTILVLLLLFMFQKQGTAGVGRVFGPVMLLWFATIALLGVRGIAEAPQVVQAIDPLHAFRFLRDNGLTGYLVLGAVFLVVTGGEALYADMGHFGASPIRLGWFTLVLPALLLNYFGQGAIILARPGEVPHPFYNLVPPWGDYPMVVLATLVTVIASQAVISGAFSLTRQAVLLRYCPPVTIVQTSSEEIGQIYVPVVNWGLMIATVSLVIGFGSSTNLTAAYGVAVSTTMVITTGLVFLVVRRRWGWPLWLAVGVTGLLLVIDVGFLGANLFKFDSGGWLPLLVGAVVLFLMATWRRGRELLAERVNDRSVQLDMLLPDLAEGRILRIPGTAVFLTGYGPRMPSALMHHLKLNQVLRETVVLLTTVTEEEPRVPAARRFRVEHHGYGFHRLYVHYGFMQAPNVPVAVRLCQSFNLIDSIDPDNIAYYLSRATLIPVRHLGGMAHFRKRIYALLARNAVRAGDFYQLPPGRSMELGVQIEL
jgi:KUP system potassium uptake protein